MFSVVPPDVIVVVFKLLSIVIDQADGQHEDRGQRFDHCESTLAIPLPLRYLDLSVFMV
jgi:hypothetical protein